MRRRRRSDPEIALNRVTASPAQQRSDESPRSQASTSMHTCLPVAFCLAISFFLTDCISEKRRAKRRSLIRKDPRQCGLSRAF
jgi:hypothetical protein